MKKALAKNIKTQQLLEILKKFDDTEYVDIEVYEFTDGNPAKIVIRTSRQEDKQTGIQEDNNKGDIQPGKDILDNIQNPKISENITYKDLLDNLN